MMLIERLRSDNCIRITSKHIHGDSRLWISGYANCFEIPISSLKEIQVNPLTNGVGFSFIFTNGQNIDVHFITNH